MTERVLSKGQFENGRMHYGASGRRYTLDDKSLKDIDFEGSFTSEGTVCVRYPNGLHTQAESIADVTADLLSQVQERLGVVITMKCRIYLLRVDEVPQNLDTDITAEPNEFPLPLFVAVGTESWQAILAQNRIYPFVLLHEMVEMSLTRGLGGGPVLPDVEGDMAGLRMTLNNYTRWFREGLANYAGHLACEIAAKSLAIDQGDTHPFSALQMVGNKVFSWLQSTQTKDATGYYDAALGLFLLIQEESGEQAIRDIVREVARRETVDGRDLIDITNRTIGADIEARVRAFRFPHVGVELTPVTASLVLNEGLDVKRGLFVKSVESNSLADQAGLKNKDVITSLGSMSTASPLDFELGLFRARRQPTASLTIHRQAAGTLTIDLPVGGSTSAPK